MTVQGALDRSAAITWLLLAGAIASEVTASLSLKGALDHAGLYAVVAVGYLTSFGFLSAVLRRGMPLGVAYGIWGALGVALTAVFSAVIFGERLTLLMGGGLVLVMAGVLTVELGSQAAGHAAEAKAEVGVGLEVEAP